MFYLFIDQLSRYHIDSILHCTWASFGLPTAWESDAFHIGKKNTLAVACTVAVSKYLHGGEWCAHQLKSGE